MPYLIVFQFLNFADQSTRLMATRQSVLESDQRIPNGCHDVAAMSDQFDKTYSIFRFGQWQYFYRLTEIKLYIHV